MYPLTETFCPVFANTLLRPFVTTALSESTKCVTVCLRMDVHKTNKIKFDKIPHCIPKNFPECLFVGSAVEIFVLLLKNQANSFYYF